MKLFEALTPVRQITFTEVQKVLEAPNSKFVGTLNGTVKYLLTTMRLMEQQY